jgi:hypothetical protein
MGERIPERQTCSAALPHPPTVLEDVDVLVPVDVLEPVAVSVDEAVEDAVAELWESGCGGGGVRECCCCFC